MTNQIELIGNTFAGYGHRTLTIIVDGVTYSATTSNMRMTDNLKDDDDDIVAEAKQDAIDYVLSANNLK
jgi:hypothetical protein